MPITKFRKFFTILSLLSIFVFLSWSGVGICQTLFLYVLGDHMVFIFHSVDMVYYLNWFLDLNQPCISRLDPTWSWCIILIHCRIWFAHTLLRIFASYNSLYVYIGLQFCLLVTLACFYYEGNTGLKKWVGKCLGFFLTTHLIKFISWYLQHWEKARLGKVYLGFSMGTCITMNWENVQNRFLGLGCRDSDSESLQQGWGLHISYKLPQEPLRWVPSCFTLRNSDRLSQAGPAK